ncbi:Sec14p-like phosphatidylinositol transfer family protein, partial [Striga asiatica]
MAEETNKTAPEAPCAAEEVSVPDVPAAEKAGSAVVEKESPLEMVEKVAEEAKAESAAVEKMEKDEASEGTKISESASFKEESNKADELVDPEKKALDDFKFLIQEALSKHEFTAPPPPPPAAVEEEKKKEEEEPATEEKKDEEPKTVEKTEACAETPAEPAKKETPEPVKEKAPEPVKEKAPEPVKEKAPEPVKEVAAKPVDPVKEAAEEKKPDKSEEKAAEAVEEIKETIVHEVAAPVPPCEEPALPPPPPEEVSIWGVPLLADEKSDSILLKFLRARDFKVKEAFAMLKSVVTWRKEFEIEKLLEEETILEGLEKVVYMHGVDKEGHPVCFNALGEFQDKELYDSTFADAEKRDKFLKWYIQLLEKNVRKLDFSPGGICTIVQIIDLNNSPGLILFKKELRQANNQALQLLQDNYPEFVAKQVFINVPWWYLAYNRMISPFLTQRTKSKFVFAGSTRTAETLFKYIAPEQVPVQYGGLSKLGDQEFTTADPASEEIIKPTCKHIIELPITEVRF